MNGPPPVHTACSIGSLTGCCTLNAHKDGAPNLTQWMPGGGLSPTPFSSLPLSSQAPLGLPHARMTLKGPAMRSPKSALTASLLPPPLTQSPPSPASSLRPTRGISGLPWTCSIECVALEGLVPFSAGPQSCRPPRTVSISLPVLFCCPWSIYLSIRPPIEPHSLQ